QKNAQQKAEDIIYTLNHAVTCLTVTDLAVIPGLSALGMKFLQYGHHHDHKFNWREVFTKEFWSFKNKEGFFHSAGEWFIGEAVGDLGAVVPTLAAQRFAPGFMQWLRHTLEPVVGSTFRSGSNQAARDWADKKGIARDDPQVKARADRLYEYE